MLYNYMLEKHVKWVLFYKVFQAAQFLESKTKFPENRPSALWPSHISDVRFVKEVNFDWFPWLSNYLHTGDRSRASPKTNLACLASDRQSVTFIYFRILFVLRRPVVIPLFLLIWYTVTTTDIKSKVSNCSTVGLKITYGTLINFCLQMLMPAICSFGSISLNCCELCLRIQSFFLRILPAHAIHTPRHNERARTLSNKMNKSASGHCYNFAGI